MNSSIKYQGLSQLTQHSNVLIISHHQQHFNTLSTVLGHYFPNQQSSSQTKNLIQIKNKYYSASVKLNNISWDQVHRFKKLSEQTELIDEEQSSEKVQNNQYNNESMQKIDLLIMLISQKHSTNIQYENLDNIIESFNPQEFVIFIDKIHPEQPWKEQDVIMQKCNNFIEIVKQDLLKVSSKWPMWNHGSLLNGKEDEQSENLDMKSGIFSLLDRMETTRWTKLRDLRNMNNNIKNEEISQLNKIKKYESIQIEDNSEPQINTISHNQNPEKTLIDNKQTQIQQKNQAQAKTKISNSQNEKKSPEGELESDEPNEKDIQAEMLQFESMMNQMLSLKNHAQNMQDTERKLKAEQLFGKMFKGMMM